MRIPKKLETKTISPFYYYFLAVTYLPSSVFGPIRPWEWGMEKLLWWELQASSFPFPLIVERREKSFFTNWHLRLPPLPPKKALKKIRRWLLLVDGSSLIPQKIKLRGWKYGALLDLTSSLWEEMERREEERRVKQGGRIPSTTAGNEEGEGRGGKRQRANLQRGSFSRTDSRHRKGRGKKKQVKLACRLARKKNQILCQVFWVSRLSQVRLYVATTVDFPNWPDFLLTQFDCTKNKFRG